VVDVLLRIVLLEEDEEGVTERCEDSGFCGEAMGPIAAVRPGA
jgi:hypothetical protein